MVRDGYIGLRCLRGSQRAIRNDPSQENPTIIPKWGGELIHVTHRGVVRRGRGVCQCLWWEGATGQPQAAVDLPCSPGPGASLDSAPIGPRSTLFAEPELLPAAVQEFDGVPEAFLKEAEAVCGVRGAAHSRGGGLAQLVCLPSVDPCRAVARQV